MSRDTWGRPDGCERKVFQAEGTACAKAGAQEGKEARVAKQRQLRDSRGRGHGVGSELDLKSWRPQGQYWAGPEHCRSVWLDGLHRLLGGERAAPGLGQG